MGIEPCLRAYQTDVEHCTVAPLHVQLFKASHRAIFHSSQCFTTGVPKAMVCDILSV